MLQWEQRRHSLDTDSTATARFSEDPAVDRSFQRAAFTMIELLVVLAMITMAAAAGAVAVE